MPDTFFVPGYYVWNGAGYVWRAGYWARVQPGYVWVPASYRWTPGGYVFVPGYWDLAVSRRGVVYAPVIISPAVIGVGFVYTPYYAVSDVVIVESLWVRPSYCHYYFGDYYGVAYAGLGFECAFVWGRRRYEPIVVYESWHHRADPTWVDVQIRLSIDRQAGRAPLPPRTLAAQLAVPPGRGGPPVVMPHNQVVAAQGLRSVQLDNAARLQARDHALRTQEVAVQRSRAEVSSGPGGPTGPRTAELRLPSTPTGSRTAADTHTSSGISGQTAHPGSSGSPGNPGHPGSGVTGTHNPTGGPGSMPPGTGAHPGTGQQTGPGGKPLQGPQGTRPGGPGTLPPGGTNRPGGPNGPNGPNGRPQDRKPNPNDPPGSASNGYGGPSGGGYGGPGGGGFPPTGSGGAGAGWPGPGSGGGFPSGGGGLPFGGPRGGPGVGPRP
jgi:hypothetical protein